MTYPEDVTFILMNKITSLVEYREGKAQIPLPRELTLNDCVIQVNILNSEAQHLRGLASEFDWIALHLPLSVDIICCSQPK